MRADFSIREYAPCDRDGGPVTLIVLARNAAARRFYSAAGYREFELRLVKGLD